MNPQVPTLSGPRSGPTSAELRCISRQLGRRVGLLQPVSRIAARCSWRCPAVIEDLPYDENGRPFPTLFYATCPTLVYAVQRLEGVGAVGAYSRLLAAAGDPSADVRAAVAAATRFERRRRRALARGLAARGRAAALDGGASLETGIGGVAATQSLKCLHAHAAHALARPGYLLGERVLREAVALAPLWCDDGRCTGWLIGEE